MSIKKPYLFSDILSRKDKWYVSGALTFLRSIPVPPEAIRPNELKKMLSNDEPLVGFQTRNPLHRSHFELTRNASDQIKGKLLLSPCIGPIQPGDINTHVRMKCYRSIIKYYPENEVIFCPIPFAMRMAGPREALLHAILRKNYGCSHFIVGRDHASPSCLKKDKTPFFSPYAAQELLTKFAKEIGIIPLFSEELVYITEEDRYLPLSKAEPFHTVKTISGSKLRRMLADGEEVPDWYSFPEIINILKEYYQSRGMCIYLIGLSGAGKSTIASALVDPFEQLFSKSVHFLDASLLRKTLFPELGFSQAARSENVRRIGKIVSMLVDAGAICIVANCAPIASDRLYIRNLISQYGSFYEIFVDTPIETCIQRDPKGLYQKYLKGDIQHMIGIDIPFEYPEEADLIVDGSDSLDALVNKITNSVQKKYKSEI